MLGVKVTRSNRIIKKGDYFSIYVTTLNGYNEKIFIDKIKIYHPTGFKPQEIYKRDAIDLLTILEKTFENKDFSKIASNIINPISLFVEFIGVFKKYRQSPEHLSQSKEKMKKFLQNMDEDIIGPFIIHTPRLWLHSQTEYREAFNILAGTLTNMHLRPDTYTIYTEITYRVGNVTHYKIVDIDISIFPSLGSMLLGSITGSILGTSANSIRISDIFNNPTPFLASLFVNIILGFVIGVVLMRKKDVQPFLTVEDFWGGLLLGFGVGYLGKDFFDKYWNI